MNKRQPMWLMWLAIFIVFFGGLIAFMLSMQPPSEAARQAMSVTIAVTAVTAGICVICATADWWMHR